MYILRMFPEDFTFSILVSILLGELGYIRKSYYYNKIETLLKNVILISLVSYLSSHNLPSIFIKTLNYYAGFRYIYENRPYMGAVRQRKIIILC